MKFSHPDLCLSGLVVALSALRSHESPACGEYPDLAALGDLASAWGLDLIQLLPVNDSGHQSSPYSALSAFALHPLYIRVADLPEAKGVKGKAFREAAAQIASRFAGDERLRYGPYLEEKLWLLERIWKEAGEKLVDMKKTPEGHAAADFDAWISENSWVKAYAVFSELKRRNEGKHWKEWPLDRDPDPRRIEALWEDPELESGNRFRAWLQWRAEGQFRAAANSLAGRGIELMGDLPILISEDSAEVWARRPVFRLGLAAGAPPDMYSRFGQNWGFPIYDWEALAKDDYGFWRERLASAEKFYSAYRIDHVLGFFRIWALGERERTGYLGRFVPDAWISGRELADLGFGPERLRWLSEPHIREKRLIEACGSDAIEAKEAEVVALDRVGGEDLFRFKAAIKGDADIEALARKGAGGYGEAGLADRARDFLVSCWRDRVLLEFEPGRFYPTWRHNEASAWSTLTDGERESLSRLFDRKRAEGEKIWEGSGRLLLGLLEESSDMLPCAEDLGAVPACVPRVLEDLGILGLRVLRWTREWEKPGEPFVPLSEYPRLTVACPSVHDSSSFREWWESEADRRAVWRLTAEALGRDLGPAPDVFGPEAALSLLQALSMAASGIVVFPFQDLLALGTSFRPADPKAERVNVPGTANEWNWGWRLPAPLEAIAGDAALGEAVRAVAAARGR